MLDTTRHIMSLEKSDSSLKSSVYQEAVSYLMDNKIFVGRSTIITRLEEMSDIYMTMSAHGENPHFEKLSRVCTDVISEMNGSK